MTTQLDRLTAARQALAEPLCVTVTELQDSQGAQYMPTFGEYLPIVIAAAGPGANRTYGTYWNRMATTWAHRRLDELHASEAMKTPPLQPPDHDAPAATADTPATLCVTCMWFSSPRTQSPKSWHQISRPRV
jgi:hypothetical protein